MTNINDKINDFFNDPKFKDVGYKISDGLGKIGNMASGILSNFMNLTTNLSNWMGSSYFPYILMAAGGVFLAYKLKMI